MDRHPCARRILYLNELFVIHLIRLGQSCREFAVKCKTQTVFGALFEDLICQFFLFFCISIQACIIFQKCQMTDPVDFQFSLTARFQTPENIRICLFFAQEISVCPEGTIGKCHRFFSFLRHVLFKHRSTLPQIDTAKHRKQKDLFFQCIGIQLETTHPLP